MMLTAAAARSGCFVRAPQPSARLRNISEAVKCYRDESWSVDMAATWVLVKYGTWVLVK